MRLEGNGFTGTCACTTSAPEAVHNRDGCKPPGSTICSSPKLSRSLPSAPIISGIFGWAPVASLLVSAAINGRMIEDMNATITEIDLLRIGIGIGAEKYTNRLPV